MRVAHWHPTKYDHEYMKAAMDRLEKVGELIADKARDICPVKTGALKASIRVVKSYDPTKHTVRIYAGSKKVFYARFVEYSHGPKGHAYLRPALAKSKAQGRKILQGEEDPNVCLLK
jgi:hypothetical protein